MIIMVVALLITIIGYCSQGNRVLNLWCIMSIYRIDGPPEYQHFGTNLACPGVILGLAPAQFPVPSELRPRVLSAKTP